MVKPRTEDAWRSWMITVYESTMPHPPVKHRPARQPRKRLPVLTNRRRLLEWVDNPPMIRRP